jgi:hypothetical protein
MPGSKRPRRQKRHPTNFPGPLAHKFNLPTTQSKCFLPSKKAHTPVEDRIVDSCPLVGTQATDIVRSPRGWFGEVVRIRRIPLLVLPLGIKEVWTFFIPTEVYGLSPDVGGEIHCRVTQAYRIYVAWELDRASNHFPLLSLSWLRQR